MTRIKGQLTTADYLPISEFYKLINNLEADGQYMWEAYCWLSFCTAFRCSDVRTLRWRDVLNRSELTRIEQKTKKNRMVKFSDDVRQKTQHLYELSGCPDVDSLILYNPRTGEPYTIVHINRQLKVFKAKYRMKIRAFSTHTFRKTFGRYVYELMKRSPEALVLLNQIFKHSTIETTRRYIGLAQEDIDKVFMSIHI